MFDSDLSEASLDAAIEGIKKLGDNDLYLCFRPSKLVLPPIWRDHDYDITNLAEDYINVKDNLNSHRINFLHCNCRGCRFNLITSFLHWKKANSYHEGNYRKIISKPGRKKRRRIFN